MYRILLVDDEWFVLEGMKSLLEGVLPDAGLEIEMAQSGRQALERMEQRPADIVFTDIKMPGMTGIELIDRLAGRNPGCKIIILSGYQDFEYARFAIKHNVRDYLLKPVTRPLLTRALEKVLEELRQERGRQARLELLERQLEESIPILRERFFWEMAHGAYNAALAGLFPAPTRPHMRLLTHSLDRHARLAEKDGKSLQICLLELRHLLEQHMSPEFDFHCFGDGERLSLLLYLKPSQNAFYLENSWRDFQQVVRQEAAFSISVGVSKPFADYKGLHAAAQQAAAALNNKLYSGAGTLMLYDNLQTPEDAGGLYPDFTAQKRSLAEAMSFEDFETAAQWVDSIRDHLKRQSAYPAEQVRAVAFDLFSVLTLFAFEKSLEISSEGPGNSLQRMLEADTVDEIFHILSSVLAELTQQLEQRSNNRTSKIIKSIKKYTAENLGSDLSLEVLSGVVYLTPNYIGLLFRKETGMSYKDYLTGQRIDRAKELLREGSLKIYEVAEQVGYKSVTYFSKIFKSNTGVYPSEYN